MVNEKGFIKKSFDMVSKVVFSCTVVTALTPSKVDDALLQKGLNLLNMLAGNVLNNKNADAVKAGQDLVKSKGW